MTVLSANIGMSKLVFTGRVWKYGNNIDTDVIYPGLYLEITDINQMGKYAMIGEDNRLVRRGHPGDIIVAGNNFGCGSSREHAPTALKQAGIAVVVAASFARTFYRNSLNVGLPLLVCPGAEEVVDEGDEVEVNLNNSILRNLRTGESLQGHLSSQYELQLLAKGGVVMQFRSSLKSEVCTNS